MGLWTVFQVSEVDRAMPIQVHRGPSWSSPRATLGQITWSGLVRTCRLTSTRHSNADPIKAVGPTRHQTISHKCSTRQNYLRKSTLCPHDSWTGNRSATRLKPDPRSVNSKPKWRILKATRRRRPIDKSKERNDQKANKNHNGGKPQTEEETESWLQHSETSTVALVGRRRLWSWTLRRRRLPRTRGRLLGRNSRRRGSESCCRSRCWCSPSSLVTCSAATRSTTSPRPAPPSSSVISPPR